MVVRLDKLNILMLSFGIIIIIGFLYGFFLSKNLFDLLYVSVGFALVIGGYYVKDRKIKDIIAYFFLFILNIFQWSILLYVYFFKEVYLTEYFYFSLFVVLGFSIMIIDQFTKRSSMSSEMKNIIFNKGIGNKRIKNSSKRIVIIGLGLLVTFGFLLHFLVTNALYGLYFFSWGVIMVIYGYYLEINKVEMSFNYFIIMLAAILFQLILVFVVHEIQIFGYFTALMLFEFLFKIRRSNMKYFGKYQKKYEKSSTKNIYKKLNLLIVKDTPHYLIGEEVYVSGQIKSKKVITESKKTCTNLVLKVQNLSKDSYLLAVYHNILPYKEGDNIAVYGKYFFPAKSKYAAGKELPGIKVVKMKKME